MQNNLKLKLVLVPDSTARAKLRDNNRLLVKFARNFNFIELDYLHISLQYLGSNISGLNAERIIEVLTAQIPQIIAPKIQLANMRFGYKGELSPDKLIYPVERSDYLSSFSRALHNSIKDLALDDVREDKDYAKTIYKLTVASAKRGLGKAFAKEFNDALAKFATALEFSPTHLEIWSQSFYKNATKYKAIARIPFAK